MRAVLHKDRVKARIVRHDRKNRPEGRVTEIIERSPNPIIGRLLQESGVWLVAPEDKRYGQDVLIPKGATGSAKTGQVVVVQLTEPPALFGQPVGRVKEVLGEIDDPGMEIEIAVRKYGVPHEFSDEAMALARTLPDAVRPQDKKNRVDLTDIALVTIDGEDARDFDDAVYCEPAKVGRGKGWRLLVAIADVSHYVETGSAIDIDAYDRATSVYFPRRVIPMLPEKLSNGLCSLNPNVERLCMVCDMLVTAKGDVHAYQFYPAVMFSQARFTYTEVAAILANTRGPEAAQRKELVPHLLDLHDVYQALLKERGVRGAVDFETTETQIVCDEVGRIEKIIPRTRNVAHRLIEEAMLAANVCSADYIAQSKHVGLFRVHEGPTPEKKDMLRLAGAELVQVPAAPYRNPNNYVRYSGRLAEALAKSEPNGAIWANQFDNLANREGHRTTTGEEIWAQTEGRVDGFTCAVGTGGTLAGVGLGLKAKNENVTIALTDPHGAALFNYYAHGELKAEGNSVAEGIGQGRITANLEGAPIDRQYRVSDEEGLAQVAALLRDEGLCLGLSSGINVAGAMMLAREMGPGHVIVTILCDTGFRYLSSLYNADWLRAKSLPVFPWLEAN